jgi:hypothetical protein
MKKIMLTLTFAAISQFIFAATHAESFKSAGQADDPVVKYPSGSGTITDACGNEYSVSWSCNYNCSGTDVTNQLIAWGDNNTECGFSSYTAD